MDFTVKNVKQRTSSMNFEQRLFNAARLGKNLSDSEKLHKVAEMFNVPITTLQYRLQFYHSQKKKRDDISIGNYSSESSLDEDEVLKTSDLSDEESFRDIFLLKKKRKNRPFRKKRCFTKVLSSIEKVQHKQIGKRTAPALIVISSDSEGEPSEQIIYEEEEKQEEEEVEEESEVKSVSPQSQLRRQALGLRCAPKQIDKLQVASYEPPAKKTLPMPLSKSKLIRDILPKTKKPFQPAKPSRTSIKQRIVPLPRLPPSPPPTIYYDQEQTDNEHYSGARKFTISQIKENKLTINDMCLVCGTTQDVTSGHPVFSGGLCESHNAMFKEWYHIKDPDGYYSYCTICCMGKKVVLCTTCDRCCCEACLEVFGRDEYLKDVKEMKDWKCIVCVDDVADYFFLKKRDKWKKNVETLTERSNVSLYLPFHVPKPVAKEERKPLRILSLFDGIATGLLALKELGFEIETFVASEINEDAIKLVRNRHSVVLHVGDVTKITDDKLRSLGPFDLLLGGSPCNDLSGANPRRRGLIDPEGTGILFFHFYRALRTVEPEIIPNKSGSFSHQCEYVRPFFWLFENVNSMRRIDKNLICTFLQCQPTFADAKHVSAACRPRLFWGNIPGLQKVSIKPSASDKLTVQDCLETGRTARFEKINTITAQHKSLFQGQSREQPVIDDGKYDILWTTEIERVFGVPQHYTDINNLGPRERLALLGRSWSVPVIMQLLKPLQDYFAMKS